MTAGYHQKLQPEDNETSNSNRCKAEAVKYVPVLEYFATHPPTKPYIFEAGSSIGSIPVNKTIPLTTVPGQLTVDGYFQELAAVHFQKHSFAGKFDESQMLVSIKGPLCVKIDMEPEFEASPENVDADLRQLVTCLLNKLGRPGNRPPYFDDLIKRIRRLPKVTDPSDREACLWIIYNHPAYADALKRRVFLQDFYVFYKTLFRDRRHEFIEKIDLKTCRRWHLTIICKDKFLRKFYWMGREHQCPADYLVNTYAAIFLHHFIVHGPEAAILYQCLVGVSLEEQELIIAHYFSIFFA